MEYDTHTADLPNNSYPPLQLTGERTLPGIAAENYWFQRHLAVYQYILPLAEGGRVVDLGCGEGYGTNLLATRAREAVGIDLAPEALYHARRTYRRPNLTFKYGDISSLDIEDSSFDLVCSLQVIEHLPDLERFMREILRLLEPRGTCVLSTPNRLIISPGRETPLNPFHIFEFDSRQFSEFMWNYFPEVEVMGLFHVGRLRIHDFVARKNFSQFCLEPPPFLQRRFYLPWFLPSLKTCNFKIRGTRLHQALDFIGLSRKARGDTTREEA
ncbi:MAG: methyltransferase domain-containing protein [Actinomycetota bacterium]|nr:methyltransferase domain-containing protein [Actinomycetota bacterium]